MGDVIFAKVEVGKLVKKEVFNFLGLWKTTVRPTSYAGTTMADGMASSAVGSLTKQEMYSMSNNLVSNT